MLIRETKSAAHEGIASPVSAPVLGRGLDILELLSQSHSGLTLSELSEQPQLPKNSVFRITQTQLARGYLLQESESLAFQLTFENWVRK